MLWGAKNNTFFNRAQLKTSQISAASWQIYSATLVLVSLLTLSSLEHRTQSIKNEDGGEFQGQELRQTANRKWLQEHGVFEVY